MGYLLPDKPVMPTLIHNRNYDNVCDIYYYASWHVRVTVRTFPDAHTERDLDREQLKTQAFEFLSQQRAPVLSLS